MGIRFTCPNGHKLHVKSFLAGKRGVCPQCGAKILIPAAEQLQQQAPLTLPELNRVGQVESSATLGGTLTDAGSASIVIATADSTMDMALTAEAPVPMPPPAVATLPPATPSVTAVAPTESQPFAAAEPVIVPSAVEPVSPAARYVAKRERNRRNQFVFAVMLLVAVIVLAGVLIFVLQRGSASAAASNSRVYGETAPSFQPNIAWL